MVVCIKINKLVGLVICKWFICSWFKKKRKREEWMKCIYLVNVVFLCDGVYIIIVDFF